MACAIFQALGKCSEILAGRDASADNDCEGNRANSKHDGETSARWLCRRGIEKTEIHDPYLALTRRLQPRSSAAYSLSWWPSPRFEDGTSKFTQFKNTSPQPAPSNAPPHEPLMTIMSSWIRSRKVPVPDRGDHATRMAMSILGSSACRVPNGTMPRLAPLKGC